MPINHKQPTRTVKQQAWVEAMLRGDNPTEAARAAKYAIGTEKQAGHVNMTNHDLTAEIDRRRAELSEKTEWTIETALKKLQDIITKSTAANQYSSAVSAIVAANRMFGMDKQTITTKSEESPIPESEQTIVEAASRALTVKLAKNTG